MNQTDLSKFRLKPRPKALSNHKSVILSIKKAIANGSSFLFGLDYPLVVPYTNGVVTYYGEQQFSYMANGVFKQSDSKKGIAIYVPLPKQGFDVSVSEKLYAKDNIPFYRVHRVEVKTIYMGSIIGLSAQQESIADILAIYNPRYMMQSHTYRSVLYEIPARSYVLIKLQ